MIGWALGLLEDAFALSVLWWATIGVLIGLTGALILWGLARAGEMHDRGQW